MGTTHKGFKLGVDLGGTKTELVLLNGSGNEHYRRRTPTPRAQGYEAIVQMIHREIGEAVAAIPGDEPYTIGMGIPGSINPETRLVQNANTTCLIGRPLQRDIENLLGRPVSVENDANCFTLAEALQGAGQGSRVVFGVIMGTGCGGGICINGSLHRGMNSIAGEWGHYAVDPGGEPCYCGCRGCVETKISGSGVEKAFYRRYNEHRSMRDITDGYRSGDPGCREIFEQFLEDFGRCLGGLVSILDPDLVVLGGGLSHIAELYTEGVARVRRYAFHRGITTVSYTHLTLPTN